MKGRRDVLLGPYLGRKPPSEVRGKSGVSIGNDFLWEPKPRVNVFEVQGGYAQSCDGGGTWEKQSCTRTSVIDDSEDGVLPPYSGQTSY